VPTQQVRGIQGCNVKRKTKGVNFGLKKKPSVLSRSTSCWVVTVFCWVVTVFATLALSGIARAEPVKVAFTGDQSVGDNARAVLQLIADEGTDLLMIQGDLGYEFAAAVRWDANLNDTVGRDFPVLVLVGNHENHEWPVYQTLTQRRIDRSDKLSCEGNVGVKASCQFENIDIVQTAPGVYEVEGVLGDDNYANYIRSAFPEASDRWRICAWHKNQQKLQTGNKGNSTGWDVYDACLDAGAMVVVAHEHAYSRSHLLSDFENQTVVHRNSDMTLKSGQSFVVVSGLGGREVRPQVRGGDWWASVYTSTQGATHGALFCTFYESTADCYFKAIDGTVPDQFTLRRGSQAQTVSPPPPQEAVASGGYVFSRTDKAEYRWIDTLASGQSGNVWIDQNCSDQLGGPTASGDWGDLVSLAPVMDSVANPCLSTAANSGITSPSTSGYVFARTDKEEYRWIDSNGSSEMGNVWIDRTCADSLGGPATSGDWYDLSEQAPAMDSIANPCTGNAQIRANLNSDASTGFVFMRTDKEEFRWVARDSSGEMANTWIDPSCANRLGGAVASGNWVELADLAPKFDALPSPCN